MDELIPQKHIEEQASEFDIGAIEIAKYNQLMERYKSLQIKYQANKIRRENNQHA